MGKSKVATKYLGRQYNKPTTELDLIPWDGPEVEISLECSEFTSHCPRTGQPDFAQLWISYVPDKHIVETKSIKLYLWSYRTKAEFNERLVQKIAQDLNHQILPKHIKVEGKFYARGGISVKAACNLGGPY